MASSKVYIGNLGDSGDRDRIWKAFSPFGAIREVWVARNPPGFAFVEFEEHEDADEAVYKMDGKRVCDKYVKVELSHRKERRERGGGRGGFRGGGGGGRRSYDDGGYRGDRGDRGRRNSPQRRRSRSPPPRGGRDRSPVGGGHYSRRSRSRSPPRQ